MDAMYDVTDPKLHTLTTLTRRLRPRCQSETPSPRQVEALKLLKRYTQSRNPRPKALNPTPGPIRLSHRSFAAATSALHLACKVAGVVDGDAENLEGFRASVLVRVIV